MKIIWFALSAQVGAGGASWPWGWQRPAHWGRRRVQHLSQEDDALLQIQTKPDGKLNYNFEKYHAENYVQGAFFDCSAQKTTKYKEKLKYQNFSANCSSQKI